MSPKGVALFNCNNEVRAKIIHELIGDHVVTIFREGPRRSAAVYKLTYGRLPSNVSKCINWHKKMVSIELYRGDYLRGSPALLVP